MIFLMNDFKSLSLLLLNNMKILSKINSKRIEFRHTTNKLFSIFLLFKLKETQKQSII